MVWTKLGLWIWSLLLFWPSKNFADLCNGYCDDSDKRVNIKKYKKEIKFSNKKVEENGKMLQKAIGLLADYHWRTTIGGQFDELASINKHALSHLADNLANI